MTDDWNNEHFRTEGSIPDDQGTVCGCTYCRACREVKRLKGMLEASQENAIGKERWARMLKVDLDKAMNQRDAAEGILKELRAIVPVDSYLLPHKIGQRLEELNELVEENVTLTAELEKADRKGHEEFERAEAFKSALEAAVEILSQVRPAVETVNPLLARFLERARTGDDTP